MYEELLLEFPRTTPQFVQKHVRCCPLGDLVLVMVSGNEIDFEEISLEIQSPLHRIFLKIGYDLLIPVSFPLAVLLTFSLPKQRYPKLSRKPATLWNEHGLRKNLQGEIEAQRKELTSSSSIDVQPNEYFVLPKYEGPVNITNTCDFDSHVIILGLDNGCKFPQLEVIHEFRKFPENTKTRFRDRPLTDSPALFLGEIKMMDSVYQLFALDHGDRNVLDEFGQLFETKAEEEVALRGHCDAIRFPISKEIGNIFNKKTKFWISSESLQKIFANLATIPMFGDLILVGISFNLKKVCRNSLEIYQIEESIINNFGIPLHSEEDWALRTSGTCNLGQPLSSWISPLRLQKWGSQTVFYPKFGIFELSGSSGLLKDPNSVRFKSYNEMLEFTFRHLDGNALRKDLEKLPLFDLNDPLFIAFFPIVGELNWHDFLEKWKGVLKSLHDIPHAHRLEITVSSFQGAGFIDLAQFIAQKPSHYRSEILSELFVSVLSKLEPEFPQGNGRAEWQRAKIFVDAIDIVLTGESNMKLLSSVSYPTQREIIAHIQIRNAPPFQLLRNFPIFHFHGDLDLKKISFSFKKISSQNLIDFDTLINANLEELSRLIILFLLNDLQRALGFPNKPKKLSREEVGLHDGNPIPAQRWVEGFFPWFGFEKKWDAILEAKNINSEILKASITKEIICQKWEYGLQGGRDRLVDKRGGHQGWLVLHSNKKVIITI